MSAYKIQWTPFSLTCLDEIFDYIRSKAKSSAPAKKVVSNIIKRTEQLQSHPLSGNTELLLIETGQGSRYIVEGNYKIIYQIEDNNVIITDVFHVKQNPKKVLKRNQ